MRPDRSLNISVLFALLILLPFVYAQSWDIHRWPGVENGGNAEILSVDEEHQAITVRFYTNENVGEFKQISCFIDNSASLTAGAETIPFSRLTRGMKVFSSGGLYQRTIRSCGALTVVNGFP